MFIRRFIPNEFILKRSADQLNSVSSFFLLALLKIILFQLFSSDYPDRLFLPFLRRFAENLTEGLFSDPWLPFAVAQPDSFPYHPMMLYAYGVFQIPAVFFPSLSKFLFILPSVFADLLIYTVLRRMFPAQRRAVLVLYGLSPVLLYSIYMHGQLDIWPTALLFYSLYLLVNDKIIKSSLFYGIALCFKVHIAAALPLFLYYVWRRKGHISAVQYAVSIFLTYSAVGLPWYLSSSFRSMVLANSKQTLLLSFYYSIGTNQLYLAVSAILIIYLRFISYHKVNKELLTAWLSVLFSVFVLLIPPAPGWYVWLLPFLMYFYLKFIRNRVQISGLYGLLIVSFIMYFVFGWTGDYADLKFLGTVLDFKLFDAKTVNLFYTFLQVSLSVNLYVIYRKGVRSNRIYTRPQSILIGIGGDSGAGKSTLLHSLERLLSPSVTLLEGDGDHRWERGNLNYEKITHLNPRANYLERQAENLIRLKKGETIYRPDYDHHTGKFTEPLPVNPTDFIILSGLHPFYLPKMRKVTDIKIYLETEDRLRLHWKIIRDTEKRGYSREKIEEQIKKRSADSDKYIRPQKNFADLIVEYFTVGEFISGDSSADPKVRLRLTVSSEFHLEDLVLQMEEEGWLSEWDYGTDLKSQYFVFSEEPSKTQIDSIASRFIPVIEEIISSEHFWEAGYLGLIQLFVMVMIGRKYQEAEIEI